MKLRTVCIYTTEYWVYLLRDLTHTSYNGSVRHNFSLSGTPCIYNTSNKSNDTESEFSSDEQFNILEG